MPEYSPSALLGKSIKSPYEKILFRFAAATVFKLYIAFFTASMLPISTGKTISVFSSPLSLLDGKNLLSTKRALIAYTKESESPSDTGTNKIANSILSDGANEYTVIQLPTVAANTTKK